MELPDLSNVRWRNLAAFGAIVGGTGLACATGGVSAAVGLGLAGIFGNIAAGDAARQWAKQRSDPKYAHPNHELTLLVGRAIARTFYDCADDPANKEYLGWFRALGKQAEASYVAISSHSDFDSLASHNLPELFEAAACHDGNYRLDSVNWSGLVEFIRAKTKQSKNPGAATIAASRLTDSLFANVREMFKRDFEGDGRAYAALCIDVNGRLLAMLGIVARDQATLLRKSSIQGDDIREIKLLLKSRHDKHLIALSEEQSKALSQLLDGFPTLVETVDSVLYEVWRTGERTQRIEERQITDSQRLVRVERLLLERFADKKPGEDPTQQQLPAELVAQVKLLRERGTKEQRAVAEIALRNHSSADSIIQELKREPLREVHRLLKLEGDNWYQAGGFDRAIEPHEKAMALQPEDFTCRNNVTIAHAQARLGDIAVHRLRAIEVGEGTLRLLPNHSDRWAITRNNLGNAWADLPTGDRGENLRKAIECYEAALTVLTKQAHPVDWAMTQNNLGVAWQNLPTGDSGENLRAAIECYEAALTVRTKQAHPVAWAGTQQNLAIALTHLAQERLDEKCKLLKKAIACGKGALMVYTPNAFPREHAMTTNNLRIDRTAYESAGCAEQNPFDQICPAE